MPVLASFMVPHPPLIVPEVGRGGEREVEQTIRSYEKVADEIASLAPETIVITSPHSILYGDYFHISPGKGAKGSFANFRAPSVKFSETYDEDLVDKISEISYHEDFPCGTLGEQEKELDHGTMVPLWFIRNKYKDGKIVRIGLSGLPLTDHYKLGTIIARAVNALDRKVVIVASGDLSHKLQDYGPYGFAKEGPEYDERIMDVMGRASFMLPGLSGFDICKILRRKSSCPIVFLTALGTEDNILKGYALGADEYMVKPFSIKVLYAKCLALLARSAAEKEDEKILSCGEIRMYPSRMEVRVGEREVDLPPKEYFLLKVLMENKGIVFGRDRLLDLVWGIGFDGSDRVVDNHIKKLRKSLGSSGNAIRCWLCYR